MQNIRSIKLVSGQITYRPELLVGAWLPPEMDGGLVKVFGIFRRFWATTVLHKRTRFEFLHSNG
jgi:hypothetical protein